MASRPKNAASSKAKPQPRSRPRRQPAATTPTPTGPARVRRAARDIEAATDLVPLWVAESVLNRAMWEWRTVLPGDWPAALAAKAERCFAGHRQFRRLVSAPVNGIHALRRFMFHWLDSRVARARPAMLNVARSQFPTPPPTHTERCECSRTIRAGRCG